MNSGPLFNRYLPDALYSRLHLSIHSPSVGNLKSQIPLSSMDLHIFFLPFLAPGHMLPMVDLARLVAGRGVKATVVTTPANASLIGPSIDRANSAAQHPIHLLTLPFPSTEPGLPKNLVGLPTPDITRAFHEAIDLLEAPFKQLVTEHRPDCIVSDVHYFWTSYLTEELGIPRLVFHVTSFFSIFVMAVIDPLKLGESAGNDEPFDVAGLPHRIQVTRSQFPDFLLCEEDVIQNMSAADRKTYGMVLNSFYEMEPDYIDRVKAWGMKVWHVGPLSLCNGDIIDKAVRGDTAAVASNECLRWLDSKKPSSVLYVCFGSLGRFTASQMREIASGLEASGHPFIWVVKSGSDMSHRVPEEFEKRAVEEGKGLIIKGWAPQILILNHQAIGGFLTHCGWNSSLEGISAGVPMITWPLFAEQCFNERLIVDVLRIGVASGAKGSYTSEENRPLVKGEKIRRAVIELMGEGEEADRRKKGARELAMMAKGAVEVGGSSYNDLSRLIEDLANYKTKGAKRALGTI